MKALIITMFAAMLGMSSQAQPPQIDAKSGMTFGKEFVASEAMTLEKVIPTLTEESSRVLVSAKVTSVCKAEGCWMKLDGPDGEIMVKMKDHAFLVPVSLEGKTVTVLGSALVKEISVETLKHYAEDAGKSKEEIAAIKEPQKQVMIYAEGVVVE